MGELSEFHPDQLSNLVDIQEELDKLVGHDQEDMIMSTIDNVNVVDHEVTIGADQDTDVEMTILPDIPGMEESNMMGENLDIGQTITIETPNTNESEQLNNQHLVDSTTNKTAPVKPLTPVLGQSSSNVQQLKAIRPLPEVSKGKKPLSINLANLKKNVLTKVIFTPNSQANVAPDAPLIFGEAGGQAIRIIGQNNFINSPKTITLAQARQLLSPGKVQHILPNQAKGVMVDSNKTFTMVKPSPTKILPLPTGGQLRPIAPSPGLTANTLTAPHKFIIRQSPSVKTGPFANTILTQTGQGQLLQLPVSQENQIHQIQLPGKQQVQFVRLVTTSTNNIAISNTGGVVKPSVVASPAPAPSPVALSAKSSAGEIKMVHIAPAQSTPVSVAPASVTQVQNTPSSFERVVVSPGLSQLTARSTDAKSAANNIVMVPAEYVKHYKPPPTIPSPPAPPSPPKTTPMVPISAASTAPSAPLLVKAKEFCASRETNAIPQRSKTSDPPNGIRPRKPCNCTKSQCLKLYCDCFANGEFCFQCNCNSCFNNLDHEEDRQRAIKACLERNPNAFRPKIGKGYVGDERRHNKGCNCKRSGCLKNYCECYEAKIPCSNNCKCVGCRNVEDSKDTKDFGHPDALKNTQQTAVKNRLSSEIQQSACRSNTYLTNQPTRQPFNLMTQEVVEATCQCLLAQVEGGEGQLKEHVERLILEEFGRCLVQIIDCAARTTVNSAT